ncbi:MAG: hypothetical protein WAM91_05350 [Candidatus Acidiferrales bacterium]
MPLEAPAIPAVTVAATITATTSAAATAATATTTASAAATTTTTPSAKAASVATTATRRLGTRFIDLKLTAIQSGPVELRNDLFHFLAGAKFNESEPAGAAGSGIPNDTGRSHLKPMSCEKLLETFVGRVK